MYLLPRLRRRLLPLALNEEDAIVYGYTQIPFADSRYVNMQAKLFIRFHDIDRRSPVGYRDRFIRSTPLSASV
jgi:hypothetical protein